MASQLIIERRFAAKVAEEAGAIIRKNFASGIKSGMEIQKKADKTLVTKTDTDINELVIKAVRREFSDHNILGEEKSDLNHKSRYFWVTDPIDGTTVFTLGIPTSTFSLALTRDGVPIVGVVYDPFAKRMYAAEIGQGAFLNDKPIKVSKTDTLEHSAVGMAYWRSAKFDLEPLYHKLHKAGTNLLQLGSIAYMGAMVAKGSFVGFVHPANMPYDSAALKVIVEEADGKVTNLLGKEQRYDGAINGCVMSNGVLHDKLLELLKK